MNPRETKFILRAHRADGRYASDDPVFAEAMAEAARSPELAAWLAREHALDEAVARKLEAIQPPTGLRETILAGAQASRRSRRWWQQPRWLAVAAGLAFALILPAVFDYTRAPALSVGVFAHLAIDDSLNRQHSHDHAPALAAIADELATRATPFSAGLDLSPERLRDAHCARLPLGDRDAFELCFQRDGTWFHLYVMRRDHAGPRDHDRQPTYLQRDHLATAAWTDGELLYALVTRAGPAALAKVV